MKKNIVLYCVTYNSYECLSVFFNSLRKSYERIKEELDLEVFIADNTLHPLPIETDGFPCHIIVEQMHENLGYFGAIRRLMQLHPASGYDYVIISNVDLMMQEDTLSTLVRFPCEENIGWIAPQIYSELEQRDRNPKILHRYPVKKLKLLRLFFRFPLLYILYTKTLYRQKKYHSYKAGEIYAGHGSFIILTRQYLDKAGIIDYPVFLFDEEIYLAEQCRSYNLKVVYNPAIKVVDSEHVSTGKMRKGFYYKCNYEAITYILKTFYS